jgi:hypothetical protein
MRSKALPLIATILLSGAAAPVVSAHMSRPVIKGVEVGYFGSATVTHRVAVFVYSNMAPRAGSRVTVCLEGKCERALGHKSPAPWYSATFSSRGLRMGDPVRFKVVAADAAGRSKVTVSRPLLCMHNNGSTPQN